MTPSMSPVSRMYLARMKAAPEMSSSPLPASGVGSFKIIQDLGVMKEEEEDFINISSSEM